MRALLMHVMWLAEKRSNHHCTQNAGSKTTLNQWANKVVACNKALVAQHQRQNCIKQIIIWNLHPCIAKKNKNEEDTLSKQWLINYLNEFNWWQLFRNGLCGIHNWLQSRARQFCSRILCLADTKLWLHLFLFVTSPFGLCSLKSTSFLSALSSIPCE